MQMLSFVVVFLAFLFFSFSYIHGKLCTNTGSIGKFQLEMFTTVEEHTDLCVFSMINKEHNNRFLCDCPGCQVSTHPLQHLGELSPAVAAFGGG